MDQNNHRRPANINSPTNRLRNSPSIQNNDHFTKGSSSLKLPKHNSMTNNNPNKHKHKTNKLLLAYGLFITIFLIANIVLDVFIFNRLNVINQKINTSSNVNISHQIQFDCQAIALLPQNCR